MPAGGWDTGAVRGSRAKAADEREPECRRERIDAEREAKHVDFKALDTACQHAEQAQQRQLKAAAARRCRVQPAAEKVLADCSGRQVQPELGHRAGDVRGKGIGIGSRPGGIFPGVGILARGPVDSLDQRICVVAALARQDCGRIAAPARIGRASPDCYCRTAPAQAPVEHFVGRISPRTGRLHCDPGVHAEVAQPARAAGAVHLDDRFGGRRRIGRQADRSAARGAPLPRWRARHDGCTEAAAEKLDSAAHARVRSLALMV